jgi:hypothetical protein
MARIARRKAALFRLHVGLKSAEHSLPERVKRFAVKCIAAGSSVLIPGAHARLNWQRQFVASGFPVSRMLLRDDNINGQPSTEPV